MGRPKEKPAGKNHPAQKVLRDTPVKEIAAALGVAPTYIYSMKKNGMSLKMADRISDAFGDGSLPPGKAEELARQYREAQNPPESAKPGKPAGRKLSPSMDLVKQLLEVKGAFLVIPLEGIAHD